MAEHEQAAIGQAGRHTEISIEALAVNVETAAAMFSVARSTFLERVRLGDLPKPRKIGARSVWLVEELRQAARELPLADDRPAPRRAR